MTNAWPPPEDVPQAPVWPPPQSAPSASTWAPPQYQQQHPPASDWQPQYGYGMPQKTIDDKLLEWVVPINRSGLAVAAGYFALLVPPIGVLLGILALRDIHRDPQKLGKGRAWFAIVYGGICTPVFAWLVLALRALAPA
jgi:hypothetical protein